MNWPTWFVCIYGAVVALLAFWAGRRDQRRRIDRDRCDRHTFPFKLEYKLEAVTGPPGVAYECPVHGRFVPDDLPRYYPGEPEAKCKVPVQGPLYFGQMYCGRYCPPARGQEAR